MANQKDKGWEVLGVRVTDLSSENVKEIIQDLSDLDPLDHLGIKTGQIPCFFCESEIFSDKGFARHLHKDHPQTIKAIETDIRNGEPIMQHAVKLHASNRQVIAQMELWGWRQGKPRADEIQMLLDKPDGGKAEVWVRKATTSVGNPKAIWSYIYQETGVTPEKFWEGPAKVTDLPVVVVVRDPEMGERQAAARNRNISSRVLELLLAQEKPLSVEFIATTLGFTEAETMRACVYLGSKNLARNVKRRIWQAMQTHHHQTTEGVDLTVTKIPSPEPIPSPPVIEAPPAEPRPIAPAMAPTPVPDSVPTESEILTMLDMIAPQGFKAKDLPAVMEWVRATQNLIAGLG